MTRDLQGDKSPSRVYLLYPRGSRTGGPHAMHQLAWALRRAGIESYMVPLPGTELAPAVSEYDHYGVPETAHVVDEADSWVIAGETRASHLRRFARARPIIWWLSVDNAPYFRVGGTRGDQLRGLKYRLAYELRRATGLGIDLRKIAHIAQSSYARSFVYARLGVLPAMVTDFVEIDDPIGRSGRGRSRTPIVAFNPAKGMELLRPVIAELHDEFDWRAIQQMSRHEVSQLLRQADVYIDLGHHPGKDRLPREAALSGSVVLAALRGSAAFTADMPIDRSFKVDVSREATPRAIAALRQAARDLEGARAAQAYYRQWIREEQVRFADEVDAFFARGLDATDQAVPGPGAQG